MLATAQDATYECDGDLYCNRCLAEYREGVTECLSLSAMAQSAMLSLLVLLLEHPVMAVIVDLRQ